MKKLKKLCCCALTAVFMVSMCSCGFSSKEYTKQAFLMGTIVNLTYYGKDGQKAIDDSVKKIQEIEDKMSLNIEDSEINNINKNAGGGCISADPEVLYVAEKALEYGKLSDGAFDISIRPVDALWAIGTDNERVPEKSEITEALKHVDYRNIEINSDGTEISFKEKGMAIDLGGIAKGYAADELVKILKSYKIDRAIINLGGNVYMYGGKEDGQPAAIGIQDPKSDQGDYFAVVRIKDKSIVTSGNYERYFIQDGKRYHHIIDPKTGYPAENGIISSTIISDNSIDGDALSTATYIMGVKKGMELIESLDGVEAVMVTDDNKVYTSSGLSDDNFNITNKEYTHEAWR